MTSIGFILFANTIRKYFWCFEILSWELDERIVCDISQNIYMENYLWTLKLTLKVVI